MLLWLSVVVLFIALEFLVGRQEEHIDDNTMPRCLLRLVVSCGYVLEHVKEDDGERKAITRVYMEISDKSRGD